MVCYSSNFDIDIGIMWLLSCKINTSVSLQFLVEMVYRSLFVFHSFV